MKKSTIIEHTLSNGKIRRWCVRCGLHVDANGEIDLDHYTARQYLALTAILPERRCDHLTKEKNEELLEKIGAMHDQGHLDYRLRNLLQDIVRRLP